MQRGAQSDVGVTMLRTPDHSLRADYPWDPDGRMWLLIGQDPRIDVAVVEMLTFPPERTGTRPRRDHHIMRFVEVFAIVSGVGIIEDLLTSGATNPSGNQPSLGDEVDHRQLLSHSQRMLEHRKRV